MKKTMDYLSSALVNRGQHDIVYRDYAPIVYSKSMNQRQHDIHLAVVWNISEHIQVRIFATIILLKLQAGGLALLAPLLHVIPISSII